MNPTPKLPLLILALLILTLLGAGSFYFLNQKRQPGSLKKTDFIPALTERSLSCPLSSDLCKADSVKQGSFSAMLKTDTPILAAFDGQVDSLEVILPGEKEKAEIYTILTLANHEKRLAAQYYFKGSAPKTRKVKEGDIIGSSNGEPLNFLEGKSLVFWVLGLTEKGDSSPEPLTQANFK